ncbi:hypothetical protein V8F33_001342 [Rhypophila sp. PSN 637]
MRQLQLLSLYAALALAHGGCHNSKEAGDGPLDALASEKCLSEPQIGPTGDNSNWQPQCNNGTCQNPHSHGWSHSQPCFKSTKTDETYCVFSDDNFAEGRGTSFVTTSTRAAHLASYPAFTEPETIKGTNQDLVRTIPAVYDMQEFPGKGMGLVAKKDIKRGDLIMANTVSLMIDYRVFEELPEDEWMELQASAVDYLPGPHKSVIMNLSTHDGGDLTHIQKVNKITTTNAFDIDPRADDAEQDNGFFVVFPEIARMNHDCRANADYYFDHNTLTQYIHAIRPIKEGEEITLSYINPRMKHEARKRKLERIWGFSCVCHLCTRKPARIAASDSRIQQIKEIAEDLQNQDGDSRANPQMAELFISLHEQEELWGMMYEAYTYAAQEYNGAGDPWTAIKYAQLAVEWGITAVGPLESNVVDMKKLAEDPWSHWSWMTRTRKKNGWGKKKPSEEED